MTLFRFTRILLRHRVRFIHSYTPRNNILAAIVGRLLGIPVIWHERNIIYGSEKDLSRRFDFLPNRIICNSKAIAERFRKKRGIPSKVNVIFNGIDLEKFRPGSVRPEIIKNHNLSGRKVVGLISNLDKRKMPEYLLYASPYILKKYPDSFFLIIGGEFGETDKGRTNELKEMVKNLGIDEYIEFAGFMSNTSDIIRAFDIGVAVTEKEACSRAIIEVMASGKPIVAFDTGGNSELIKHGVTGVLVKFGDTQRFSDAVVSLLKNEAKRSEMGMNARKRAEKYFNVKINCRKTESIYAKLIGKTSI